MSAWDKAPLAGQYLRPHDKAIGLFSSWVCPEEFTIGTVFQGSRHCNDWLQLTMLLCETYAKYEYD